MTKYLVEGETLTDIADAIREQTGEAGQIQLNEFANKVASISGGKHTYSTTEQEVGEWIDGSPVYEKVIDLGALPNNTTKNVAHNIQNLGLIISADFLANDTSGQYIQMPFTVARSNYVNYQVSIYLTDTNIVIETGSDRSTYSGFAILRYTKTAAANLTRSQEPEEEKEETTSTEEKEGGEEK